MWKRDLFLVWKQKRTETAKTSPIHINLFLLALWYLSGYLAACVHSDTNKKATLHQIMLICLPNCLLWPWCCISNSVFLFCSNCFRSWSRLSLCAKAWFTISCWCSAFSLMSWSCHKQKFKITFQQKNLYYSTCFTHPFFSN